MHGRHWDYGDPKAVETALKKLSRLKDSGLRASMVQYIDGAASDQEHKYRILDMIALNDLHFYGVLNSRVVGHKAWLSGGLKPWTKVNNEMKLLAFPGQRDLPSFSDSPEAMFDPIKLFDELSKIKKKTKVKH